MTRKLRFIRIMLVISAVTLVTGPSGARAGFCPSLFRREVPLSDVRFTEERRQIADWEAAGLDAFAIRERLADTPESRLAYFDHLAKLAGTPIPELRELVSVGSTSELRSLKRLVGHGFAENVWSDAPVTLDAVDRTFLGLLAITGPPPKFFSSLFRGESLGSMADAMAVARARELLLKDGTEAFFTRLGRTRSPTAWEHVGRLYRASRPVRSVASALAFNRLLAALPIPLPGVYAVPNRITFWWNRHPKALLELQTLLEAGKYPEFRALAVKTFGAQARTNLVLKAVQETATWVAVGVTVYYGVTLGPGLLRETYYRFAVKYRDLKEHSKKFDPIEVRDEALESWMKNRESHGQPFSPAIWEWKKKRVRQKSVACPPGEAGSCAEIEKRWEYLLARPDESFQL